MELGGVTAGGRYKQVGAGMCLSQFCDRSAFDINLKLLGLSRKAVPLPF